MGRVFNWNLREVDSVSKSAVRLLQCFSYVFLLIFHSVLIWPVGQRLGIPGLNRGSHGIQPAVFPKDLGSLAAGSSGN